MLDKPQLLETITQAIELRYKNLQAVLGLDYGRSLTRLIAEVKQTVLNDPDSQVQVQINGKPLDLRKELKGLEIAIVVAKAQTQQRHDELIAILGRGLASTAELLVKDIYLCVLPDFDLRPFYQKLLDATDIGLGHSIKEAVNPQSNPNSIGVYACAGADWSNFALATNSRHCYFVDVTPFKIKELKAALRAHRQGTLADVKYLDQKRYAGGGAAAKGEFPNLEKRFIIELLASGVDLSSLSIDSSAGYPRVSFQWQYHGEAAQEYSVCYIEADITKPSAYPEPLQAVFKAGFDFFFQRAGNDAARFYPDYLNAVLSALRVNGAVITTNIANPQTHQQTYIGVSSSTGGAMAASETYHDPYPLICEWQEGSDKRFDKVETPNLDLHLGLCRGSRMNRDGVNFGILNYWNQYSIFRKSNHNNGLLASNQLAPAICEAVKVRDAKFTNSLIAIRDGENVIAGLTQYFAATSITEVPDRFINFMDLLARVIKAKALIDLSGSKPERVSTEYFVGFHENERIGQDHFKQEVTNMLCLYILVLTSFNKHLTANWKLCAELLAKVAAESQDLQALRKPGC